MKLTEMINKLQQIKEEHGDISCILNWRYSHHNIKWIDFSDACDGPHVCIRIKDEE